MNYALIRRAVERACGVTTVHRYSTDADGITVPANATTTFPLLTASDSPDEEVGGDFATACQAIEDSRITHVDLQIQMQTSNLLNLVSWALLMNKDGQYVVTPSELWDNSPTQDAREARKYICGAGRFFHSGADTRNFTRRIFIKRKALARMGRLGEDTTFDLLIQNDHATNAGAMVGWGRIYTKKFA